ncbi:MAG: hypothetical protein ACI9MC_003753 [Kiritimatiellia bacterium]|jgi:hypothetical protein
MGTGMPEKEAETSTNATLSGENWSGKYLEDLGSDKIDQEDHSLLALLEKHEGMTSWFNDQDVMVEEVGKFAVHWGSLLDPTILDDSMSFLEDELSAANFAVVTSCLREGRKLEPKAGFLETVGEVASGLAGRYAHDVGELAAVAETGAVGVGLAAAEGATLYWGTIIENMGEVLFGVPKAATPEDLVEQSANIAGYQVIMKKIAHQFAYVGGGGSPENLGYKNSGHVTDPATGFQCVWYEPVERIVDGEELRDIVAFRGTDNLASGQDDSNSHGVGQWQWSANEAAILGLMMKANKNGAFDVTGHSLGGALSQRAAVSYSSMVADIITFQSPGLAAGESEDFDADAHTSTHYRAEGDWVSDAGQEWTPGAGHLVDIAGADTGMSHTQYLLQDVNNDRIATGDQNAVYNLEQAPKASNVGKITDFDPTYRSPMDYISETQRKVTGFTAASGFSTQTGHWMQVRERIEELIADGELTEEQVAALAHDHLDELAATDKDSRENPRLLCVDALPSRGEKRVADIVSTLGLPLTHQRLSERPGLGLCRAGVVSARDEVTHLALGADLLLAVLVGLDDVGIGFPHRQIERVVLALGLPHGPEQLTHGVAAG